MKIAFLNFLILLLCSTSYSINHQDILVEISDCQVYIALPGKAEKLKDKQKIPVLMAIHGNGRGALSYFPGHRQSFPFYVYQRNIAVKNGFLFVVVSNGKDTWGTDKGLINLSKVYEYITENFPVQKKWVLWGTSAGGLQMFRMIREFPDRIDRVLGTFPVYDLLEAYEQRKSDGFIWKTPECFESINPANYPEELTHIPMLIFHGREDAAVPYPLHSLKLQQEVNGLGGKVNLILVGGGHSTSNWQVYRKNKINKFLRNCAKPNI